MLDYLANLESRARHMLHMLVAREVTFHLPGVMPGFLSELCCGEVCWRIGQSIGVGEHKIDQTQTLLHRQSIAALRQLRGTAAVCVAPKPFIDLGHRKRPGPLTCQRPRATTLQHLAVEEMRNQPLFW